MSNVLYYYARLNEHDVCVEFEISTRRDKGHSKLIPLVEQNVSYLYSKYNFDTKSFSQEKYEPSIDTELQEKVDNFEVLVEEQNQVINNVRETNQGLTNQVELLEGTIAELMIMLESMGGAE